ncbi:MAG: hypothetical protein HC838_05235 [Spirulinaceae cyanobacterium RM2_2_10]|nr:hypothetical protein [Spirulinaceae cyanobacterium RM2_2_10]
MITGLLFALAFNAAPQPLLGLLTSHDDAIAIATTYAPWLWPVLALGSLAFMLDGYFLGLTAGHSLRNATLLAAIAGFAPLALLAGRWQSGHWLWFALTTFMAGRTLLLGAGLRTTLSHTIQIE